MEGWGRVGRVGGGTEYLYHGTGSDVQLGKTPHNLTANTMFNVWISLSSFLTSIMLIETFSGFIGAFAAALSII